MSNRLQQLHDAGVSIWIDFIERSMLHNGDLERRIREESLTGMTSNPTIFEKALAEGSAYDEQLRDAPPDVSLPGDEWKFGIVPKHCYRGVGVPHCCTMPCGTRK